MLYFNDDEIKAIATMLEYYDTSGSQTDLNELIGVLRFKVLACKYDNENKVSLDDTTGTG